MSLDSCVTEALRLTGVPLDDLVESPCEVTGASLDAGRMYYDEGSVEAISFRESLQRLKAEGVQFPCLFATSEY